MKLYYISKITIAMEIAIDLSNSTQNYPFSVFLQDFMILNVDPNFENGDAFHLNSAQIFQFN